VENKGSIYIENKGNIYIEKEDEKIIPLDQKMENGLT
jgi:hypothetical protein